MTPKCQCTHEAGDSYCDVHPGCDYCGAAIATARYFGKHIVHEVRGAGSGRYCTNECRDKGEGAPHLKGDGPP